MVAEPDAQGGARDRSVTGMGAMALLATEGRSSAPERTPNSALLAHFRPQPQRALSCLSRARLALASRKDADNANSDPTASAHGVTAATGWHTPESRLNALGSAPA